MKGVRIAVLETEKKRGYPGKDLLYAKDKIWQQTNSKSY